MNQHRRIGSHRSMTSQATVSEKMNTFKFNVTAEDSNDMSLMWATTASSFNLLGIKQQAYAKIDLKTLSQKRGSTQCFNLKNVDGNVVLTFKLKISFFSRKTFGPRKLSVIDQKHMNIVSDGTITWTRPDESSVKE